ncbi:MAG: MFS transporter [Pseudomonadales bacterium]|nr:MFS transporter [Pseudomonadales bacterium]
MTNETAQPLGKQRYGWVIVGVLLLIQTVSSGLGFYNMSVYINRLSAELAVPVSDISFAVSLFFVVGGVAGLYIAVLLTRFNVRTIMITGTLLAGLALASVGMATEVWHVYAMFALFGMGNAGISLVVATTLITQWFPGAERSMALAVTSTGLSLGGVVLTPLSAYLLNTIGVAETMPMLGLVLVVLVVPLCFLVRQPPGSEISNSAQAMDTSAALLASAVNSRFFALMALAYVLTMASQVGGIAHLYNRVEQLTDYQTAAYAVQALSICSISGRFFGGWLVSRIPIRWFALGNLCVQALGLTCIAFAPSGSFAVLAAGLFGLSIGNLLMTQPLWLAEIYPSQIYARVFARANAISVVGVAIGPYGMGLIFDAFGGSTYTQAYLAGVTLSVTALVIVMVASRPSHMRTYRDLSPD